MKNKTVLLFLFFALFSTIAQAQYYEEEEKEETVEKESWRDKIFFGGAGGLQFSNIYTFVALMPSIGYQITPKLSGGFTANYQFVHYRDFDRSVHNYGGTLFSRYMVYNPIFATAEYEQINMNILTYSQESYRQWVDRALVGAGYFSSTGGRGGFYIAILYDLFYTNRSNQFYQSPFVYRAGFIF